MDTILPISHFILLMRFCPLINPLIITHHIIWCFISDWFSVVYMKIYFQFKFNLRYGNIQKLNGINFDLHKN